VTITGRRVLVALFLLMLPLVTTKIRGADEIQYFSHLRSLAFDRDLAFENEYRYFYDRDPVALAGFKETFLDKRDPRSGRHINFTPIGCALLWAPFYLIGHLGALATGAAADGFSWPYVAAAGYGSALYGFLGLLLTHDALRRWADVSDAHATAAVAALWWGSPLLYYMTLAPGFAHATSVLTVSLVVWLSLRAWRRAEWSPVEAAQIGLAGGLAAVVYEKELLYLVVPAALLVSWALATRRFGAALARLAIIGLAANVAFLPQRLAYRSLNGSWGPSELVQRKMIYSSPHLLEVLIDPAHGMFLWAPLVGVALLGLVAIAARRRDVMTAGLLAAFLLQIWICGSVDSWHQAGAFGSRRFVSATPVLAFGLAAMVAPFWQRWGRVLASGALLIFVWWNVSLMVQFGLKLMDRQRLEWPRVAHNQLVEVPRRIVRVAGLFFTDRERLVEESR
jgi:hypothetical protein